SKLVGNTMDLGIPFVVKASTFGQCKLQPTGSSYLPCIPAVVSWSDPYESVVLDNTGKLLVKDSTASCAIGGTIEFAAHGQEQSASQQDAQEASVQPALTPAMSEEVVRALTLGEFIRGEDERGASVKSIKTVDGKSQYFYNKLAIPFTVNEFSQSNPSQDSIDGVNWAVFHKKSGEPDSTYRQIGLYSDTGEDFIFPFKIEGDYVVEAYGSANGPFYLKNRSLSAYKNISLKDQTVDGLSVTVNGDTRERVRPIEVATIKAEPLFSNAEMANIAGENSMGRIIWNVQATYRGNSVPVVYDANPANRSELLISPIGRRADLTVSATSTTGVTKTVSYKVGNNYVTAIQSDKETVAVWDGGAEKERHKVTLTVSEFKIEPALPAEKAAVKWTNFHTGEAPDKNNVIATGEEIVRKLTSEGVIFYEAFMMSPEGGEKPTTKRVEGVIPQIKRAYWADSEGNKIARSGYGHTVYLHVETLGLTGEKFQFNVWESDTYSDSDPIKNAGTEVEITSFEGVINQEFTVPDYSMMDEREQEFYFTIEKLDFELLGTKQDPDSGNEYLLWKDHTSKRTDYLKVTPDKKITSLKIYEGDGKLHTGRVKFGDSVTIKITSRNRIDEEIEFEIWKDPEINSFKGDDFVSGNTSDDIKFSETIKIKVDKEGKGTTDFTVPMNWKDYQGDAQTQFFYLKEGGDEYPRANFTNS
ncbi:MAG: PAAR-like protein, partial [Crocinitomicaceae bacterium]